MTYTFLEYADQLSVIDFELSELNQLDQAAAEEFLQSISAL